MYTKASPGKCEDFLSMVLCPKGVAHVAQLVFFSQLKAVTQLSAGSLDSVETPFSHLVTCLKCTTPPSQPDASE